MTGDLSFEKLLAVVSAAPSSDARRRIIDDYLADRAYPVFEDENTVLLLYRGEVDGVSLIGDMTDWIDQVPFTRVPETDLFWFRGHYESDARLEYVLRTSGSETLCVDPLNPYRVNGFVLNAELAMPHYRRQPVFEHYRDGRTGGYELLREYTLPAGALSYPHTIHLYLPPDYDAQTERYPCVYFQDGRDYIEYGIAPLVLHTLVTHRLIPPVVGVFVTPPNLHLPQKPNRTTEYGMNAAYVAFFTGELRSWVDAHVRTVRDASARLVVGDSYGGLISATIGLRSPDVFGNIYSQSGYMSFQNDRLHSEIARADTIGGRFLLDCGTYERRVACGIIPDAEGDFLEANRRLAELLRHRGADIEYREYPEGHTWGNWRGHLHTVLTYFLNRERPT